MPAALPFPACGRALRCKAPHFWEVLQAMSYYLNVLAILTCWLTHPRQSAAAQARAGEAAEGEGGMCEKEWRSRRTYQGRVRVSGVWFCQACRGCGFKTHSPVTTWSATSLVRTGFHHVQSLDELWCCGPLWSVVRGTKN